MNKKLSIIMLLSCVGNVFSMGGGAAGGGNQRPLTLKERTTKAVEASSKKMRDQASTIYVSATDLADSKTAAALAGAACTVSGLKVLELPASQDALDKAKELLMSSKEIGYVYACSAGSATCSFLSKARSNLAEAGSIALSKASSVSREAVEFIAQHKVGACVAGAVTLGSAAYGIYKYKETKAATKQAESAGRKLQEAEEAKTLSDFLANFGGDVNGDNGVRTPLVAAAEANNLPLVELLIATKANVNQKLSAGSHAGRDALFFAANWGRPEIVKALLSAGADNFDIALSVAEGNKDKSYDNTGTHVEYQAVIDSIEAAQKAAK